MPHGVSENRMVISFITIRKTIGFLAVLLPVALLAGTALFSECYRIQDSISHYYFTVAGDVFVGVLCVVALFLIAYKGYGRADNISTTIAGIMAIVIALVPTTQNESSLCSVLQLKDNVLRVWIHYTAAAIFFLTLAYIAFFLFTKSRGGMSPEKKLRNNIYRSCAGIMLACIVLVFAATRDKLSASADAVHAVFWLEWIALLAFGTSWLVKGELLLTDEENSKSSEPQVL